MSMDVEGHILRLRRYLDQRQAWDEAVCASAHDCPQCGPHEPVNQVQLVNSVDMRGPKWKCRMCGTVFHTAVPEGVVRP